MNIMLLGDTMVRETRPASYIESKDAAGNVVSVMPELAPIWMVAEAPASSNVEVERGGPSILPIALGVSALAYFMFKG